MKYPQRQSGMTLIELMVGIAIGLMAIATALGALIVARGLAGTTNEASTLQQQAAYISRALGMQLRQAGAIQLSLNFSAPESSDPGTAFDKVAFLTTGTSNPSILGDVSASQNNLTTRYQNYQERLYSTTSPGWQAGTLFSDCAGGSTGGSVINAFRFKNGIGGSVGSLACAGSAGTYQPVADNMLQFVTRYIYQTGTATGTPLLQTLTTAQVLAQSASSQRERWAPVVAVNVCFVLTGTERIDTDGGTYVDCEGASKSMGNRLVMVFRNTFQVRSQGSPV